MKKLHKKRTENDRLLNLESKKFLILRFQQFGNSVVKKYELIN